MDERGLRGPPDWVIGVPSRSTAGLDPIHKLAAYERAVAFEVSWVHPFRRALSVFGLREGHTYAPRSPNWRERRVRQHGRLGCRLAAGD
ncbi:MAG: Uma2 family endonuclease [Xanthomonadales bacterium]|nr:Uma2 family endonuclease [Xanthomonadales bacterium]